VLDPVGAVLARVDDQDAAAVAGEPRRGGEPGRPSPDDDDVDLPLDRNGGHGTDSR
jgi:hypothetical protein